MTFIQYALVFAINFPSVHRYKLKYFSNSHTSVQQLRASVATVLLQHLILTK